jgi:hypothetical protein
MAASLRAFVDLAQETISATPRRAWSVGFLIGLTIGRRSARWRPISVASSTFRPTPPKMDRAILSYSPPLRHLELGDVVRHHHSHGMPCTERAILRRLTRAPTLMLHPNASAGALGR